MTGAMPSSDAERFRVVVADPPWRFGDALPGPRRGASKHYSTLAVHEIQRFPLPPIADVAHLFLWRVASMQQEALDVASAWGFVVKSEIVWRKRTKNGLRWFGMGRQVRMEHEVCLIATRGSAKTRVRNQRSILTAFARDHSRKPDEFYDLVERLCEGPYVELFSRHRRPDWTMMGNEVP